MWPLSDELPLSPPGRVLWITDLDDISLVLPLAVGYASRAKAQVRLLYTLETTPQLPLKIVGSREETLKDRTLRATGILERTTAHLRSAGIECDWQLETAPLEFSLREASEAWEPDRIIRARRSEAFSEGLDPDTEIILRDASVPVLVINPKNGPAALSKPLRILFPTSLDRQERATANSVLRFARAHGARITMLHVIEDGPNWNSRVERVRLCAEQQFREILGEFEDFQAETLIELGGVTETVVRIAQHGYDLLLLSVFSGSSFRSDIRPGSAYKILCNATRPVLVCKRNVPHHLLTREQPGRTLVGSLHLPPA